MAAATLFLCRKRALAALCLGLLHGEDEESPRKRNRKVHMRQWISRREERGVFHQLIKELEVGDVVVYKEFFRITKEQFCLLLGKVSPLIQKKRKLVFSVRHVFFLICREAELRWQPITSVEVKFVARQVEASVVIRATKVKFVAESRTRVYFSQPVASTCNMVFRCETSWPRR